MKIAIRGGHNFAAKGAAAIIDETVEDRKVKDAVIKYLKLAGQDVQDVTPPDINDVNKDLKWGVDKANAADVDLFISIHFNKAYDAYEGAIGSECWTIGAGRASDIAGRITKKLSEAGFKNRGVKHKAFYELRQTKASAIIVEVCFVEATEDVKIYKQKGPDYIGKKIAEGIVGAEITAGPAKPSSEDIFRVKVDGKQVGAYKQKESIVNALKDSIGKAEKIEIERR